MNVVFGSEKIPWFGNRTGYEVLPRFLRGLATVQEVVPRPGLLPRLMGKTISVAKGLPPRHQSLTLADAEFVWRARRSPRGVAHLLYADSRLAHLAYAPPHLCGTLHLPFPQWSEEMLAALAKLDLGILLYRRDLAAFQNFMPRAELHFLPHGADVDFFRPGNREPTSPPRLLYSGTFLRNTAMLERVVTRLHARHPELIFDLLVPRHARADPALEKLQGHPAVQWHAGLNDEELRALYQRSYLLLLPMKDSGANTAVVEALASGLPLVTTDVGGIRDYGGGTLFPLVANNEDDAMVALVEAYLAEPARRDEVSRQCRRFAEDELAWPRIAQRHLELYQNLLDGPTR